MGHVEGYLHELRPKHDLYFDCGDSVTFGNLAIPLRPDPCWPAFERLNLTASVLGNRESHFQPSVLRAKIKGATHPIVVCNLFERGKGPMFPSSHILTHHGLQIGVIGAMVEITPRTQKFMGLKVGELSPLTWEKAEPLAIAEAHRLRPQCDLVILLSHLGYRRDCALAEGMPPIDIILGGHSHTVLESPQKIGQTYLAQAGSHGHWAGSYQWDQGRLEGKLIPLLRTENNR